MRKQIVDIVYGAVAFLFSIFCLVYLIPTQIRVRAAYAAETRLFPQWAAVVVGFAGLAIVVTRLKAMDDRKALFDWSNYAVDLRAVARQIVFLAVMAAFLWLIPVLGFVLASVLFLNFMFIYFGSRTPIKNVAASVVFSVCAYLLFSRLFQVNLAPGLLPF